MEAFVVSLKPHTLEEATGIFETFKSGRYGKWKPTKASGGMIVDSMNRVPRERLASMRPPQRCIYISLMTAIQAANYAGDLRSDIPGLLRPFIFPAELSAEYTLSLRVEDRCHTINISLPNGANPGVIILRINSRSMQAEKEALCALIGLKSCLREGEGILLDLSGMDTVRLKKPRKYESGTHIVFDDFPAAVDLLTRNLANDTECGALTHFCFNLCAGYMDVDEELENGRYDDVYRLVAEHTGFPEFHVSSNRFAVNGSWKEKEEARLSIGDGPGFTESLGSITDGAGAVVKVSLQYDASGYTYLFDGFEKVTDEDSSLMAITEDIPLTM